VRRRSGLTVSIAVLLSSFWVFNREVIMRDEQIRGVAAAGLVIGALLGMVGSFAPTAELRGLAWGTDGIALVVANALLALHHLRRGDVQLAAGFLVFLLGETLVVSGSAMELAASAPLFAAGAGLWSAALALVSASPVTPKLVRVTGAIAAILFAVTAAAIFGGAGLTALSEPLPFYAYPFLAATLFGWAWVHRPSRSPSQVPFPDAARGNDGAGFYAETQAP
jgi:hypothetical protein